MTTGGIIAIVVVAVIIVALVGWFMWTQQRRRQLRERFGPEYDRAVENSENPRAAERELAEREKRHAQLDVKPLSSASRERYARQWSTIQEQFVDHPGTAVSEADRLVAVVMGERGYPTEGYEQQLADLSVRHSSRLEHYRDAHEIKSRNDQSRASTEELREAMVHYRALFEELIRSDADGNGNGHRG